MTTLRPQNTTPAQPAQPINHLAKGVELNQQGKYKEALLEFNLVLICELKNPNFDRKELSQARKIAFENYFKQALTYLQNDKDKAYEILTQLSTQKDIDKDVPAELLKQVTREIVELEFARAEALLLQDEHDAAVTILKRLEAKKEFATEFVKIRLKVFLEFSVGIANFYNSDFQKASLSFDKVITMLTQHRSKLNDQAAIKFKTKECKALVSLADSIFTPGGVRHNLHLNLGGTDENLEQKKDPAIISQSQIHYILYVSYLLKLVKVTHPDQTLPFKALYIHAELFFKAQRKLSNSEFKQCIELCDRADKVFNQNPELALLKALATMIQIFKNSDQSSESKNKLSDLLKSNEKDGAVTILNGVFRWMQSLPYHEKNNEEFLRHLFVGFAKDFMYKSEHVRFNYFYEAVLHYINQFQNNYLDDIARNNSGDVFILKKIKELLNPSHLNLRNGQRYLDLAVEWRCLGKTPIATLNCIVAVWLVESKKDQSKLEKNQLLKHIPSITLFLFDTMNEYLTSNQSINAENYWLCFKFVLVLQINYLHIKFDKISDQSDPEMVARAKIEDKSNYEIEQLRKTILLMNHEMPFCEKEVLLQIMVICKRFYDEKKSVTMKANASIVESKDEQCNLPCMKNAKSILDDLNFPDMEKVEKILAELNEVIQNEKLEINEKKLIEKMIQDIYRKLYLHLEKLVRQPHFVNPITPFLHRQNKLISKELLDQICQRMTVKLNEVYASIQFAEIIESGISLNVVLFVIQAFPEHYAKQYPNFLIKKMIMAKRFIAATHLFFKNDVFQALNEFTKIIDDYEKIDDCTDMLLMCTYAGQAQAATFLANNTAGSRYNFKLNHDQIETFSKSNEIAIPEDSIKHQYWMRSYINRLFVKYMGSNELKSQTSWSLPIYYNHAAVIRHILVVLNTFHSNDEELPADFGEKINNCAELLCDALKSVPWNDDIYLLLGVLRFIQHVYLKGHIILILDMLNHFKGYQLGPTNFLPQLFVGFFGFKKNIANLNFCRDLELAKLFQGFVKNTNDDTHQLFYPLHIIVLNSMLKETAEYLYQLHQKDKSGIASAGYSLVRFNVQCLVANYDSSVYFHTANEFELLNEKGFAAVFYCAGIWLHRIKYSLGDLPNESLLKALVKVTLYFYDMLKRSLDEADLETFNNYYSLLTETFSSLLSVFTRGCTFVPANLKTLQISHRFNSAKNFDSIRKLLCDMQGEISTLDSKLDLGVFQRNLQQVFVVKLVAVCETSHLKWPDLAEKLLKEAALLCYKDKNLHDLLANRIKKLVKLEAKDIDTKVVPELSVKEVFLCFLEKLNKLENFSDEFANLSGKIHNLVKPPHNLKLIKVRLASLNSHLEQSNYEKFEAVLGQFLDEINSNACAPADEELNLFASLLMKYFDLKVIAKGDELRDQQPKPIFDKARWCYSLVKNTKMKEMKLATLASCETSYLEKQILDFKAIIEAKAAALKVKTQEPQLESKKNPPKGIKSNAPKQLKEKKQGRLAHDSSKNQANEVKQVKKNKQIRPEHLPLPAVAKAALAKLTPHCLGKRRAYIVGGLVCEIAQPLKKTTDIDLVFGAQPTTKEDKENPENFAKKLLQKAFQGAVIEQKDKRLFKVTYLENKEEKNSQKISLDIWWSAALSCDELSDDEARMADTYGGEWAVKTYKERLKNPDEILREVPGRDFTMNAMYLDVTGKLEDPTGCGYQHLNRMRLEKDSITPRLKPLLKCIISAEDSFGVDPLRALRAVYFASKRNLMLTKPMKDTMRKLNFDKVQPVCRVTIILKKLLTRGDACRNFKLLRETGVLEKLFPLFASLLDKHPEVLNYILIKLSEADKLYQLGKFPSLNRIFSNWLFATAVMNKSPEEKYTDTDIDEKVFVTAKKFNHFYNDHFNGLKNQALNEKDQLEAELKQIVESKNIDALRAVIKRQMLSVHLCRVSQTADRGVKYKLNIHFAMFCNALAKETCFSYLLAMREAQLKTLCDETTAFEEARLAKEEDALRQAKEDWIKFFCQPKKEYSPTSKPHSKSHFVLMPALSNSTIKSGESASVVTQFSLSQS